MTSTVFAVVATPALTWLYIGQTVPVDVAGMLWSLVQIVILPIALGVLINRYAWRFLKPVTAVLPVVASAAILAAIGIIVALNHDNLATAGVAVLAAVIAHNACGLLCGYWAPRKLGFDRTTCRTLSLEVGMQNSGLSVALAVTHFSSLSALPGALFSVWHNVTGALLAGLWRARAPDDKNVGIAGGVRTGNGE
jgi:BASS family bile acid:Na+ symporter